jgi:hypothetical protein
MPCVVDDSRWPLLTVVWRGSVSNEEFTAYLGALDRNLARTKEARTRTAILMDARGAAATSSVQRKMQADWMKANEHECRRYCAGFAFVLDSAFVRGALTAILWLAPLPAEHIVCATVDEADQWLCQRLRDAGVVVPPPSKAHVA